MAGIDEALPLKGKGQAASGWKTWSVKKRMLIIGAVILVIALAIGLGVGLGVGLNKGGGDDDEGEVPPTTGGGVTTAKWQPAVGSKWQIELLYALNDTSVDADIYDIDLFNNDKSTISGLQQQGRKVICYFSAGSYENWRPDKDKFKDSDMGKTLDGWPDEKWLNLNSKNVRSIMTSRLDMAVEKGCDGVDPDNVDGYDNDNGLDQKKEDSANFMMWLANEAHARNMSIGLKNAGAIIPAVIDNMQWSVNEQCAQYEECDTYAAFINKNKPVFHIEYPKGDDTNNNQQVTTSQKNSACDFDGSANFSTVIKNMNLDNWIQTC
ncbi:endo alpha-1,4 polygalactosaminidase [Aspergillus nomiae NRRL 13137]|uniref:alpha-galactosidase n=1 Tax=Aspergillus nomiae NRRL (strain ATCC 15546 / NRRL 13137 / CBS 260.88 / M93) TaxID=1509407 RepID=A0A0L1ILE5_ASPN3|nr:endo alpha-1,4 polygalactosaminidase [Aspergillus nomiae NRRL 13137]KNG79998.1 endo alpha-1,4 polygalactosaminidase [Aspergillus nomiae NRRL 13137]